MLSSGRWQTSQDSKLRNQGQYFACKFLLCSVNFWFERGKEERLLIKKVQFTSRFSLISRVAEALLCCIIHMCGVSSRLGSQRRRVRTPLLAKYSKCFTLVKTFSIFNTSSISEMESWLAYSDKSAIDIDISRYSNSYFSKTTALNSVKVWIDWFLLLDFFLQCLRHGFW